MKVAIAGYGAEGRISAQYWLSKGAEVTVFDENESLKADLPAGVDTRLGKGVFQDLGGYDLIIRTPSLNPRHLKTDGKIWSATNEFMKECPAKVIGVTGTKGKGTTSSLIAAILKNAGETVHLLGNIGTPALEVLPVIQPEDIVVFELSSFQLWDIEKSPHIAVVLMVESDHQDVHTGMEDYVMAKANIGKFQTESDVLIHHPSNDNSLKIASLSPAQKIAYMKPPAARVVIPAEVEMEKPNTTTTQEWNEGKDEWIAIEDQLICKTNEVGLIGSHNLENICAAVTACWRLTQNRQVIAKAVKEFKGLPHRLEFVRELNGVQYYNDSFSSASGALIAAVRSFDQPLILICGGYDKGIDYTEVANVLVHSVHIKKVIVIGAMRHKIKDILDITGFRNYIIDDSDKLEQAVKKANDNAEPGDVVLLSPGTASFDMFKNFYERGDTFKRIVNSLS